MYLYPDYSKRRANVISGLAAAFVAIGMIVVAGKASADQPSSASASTPAAVEPAERSSNPDAEAKPSAAGHASHATHDHAAPSAPPAAKQAPTPAPHDPHAHASHD